MKIRPPSQREGGFTLVELLVAVVIESLILGALSMAFVAMLRGTTNMNQNLSRTGDARLAAQYIISDARNSSGPELSLNDTSSCPDPSPPVAGTPTKVARFSWTSTGAAGTTKANIVNYVLVSNNLLRRQCLNGSLISDRSVASNVGSVNVTCSPTANCSGTPTSITVTVTSTPDNTGATYQYGLTGTFRKLIGDGAPPTNPSFVFLTGIEQGVASPTYPGVFTTVTGGVNADSSTVRNGSYSLQVVPTSSVAAYAQNDFSSTADVTVARFAVRLSSLPSGDRNLVSLLPSVGERGHARLPVVDAEARSAVGDLRDDHGREHDRVVGDLVRDRAARDLLEQPAHAGMAHQQHRPGEHLVERDRIGRVVDPVRLVDHGRLHRELRRHCGVANRRRLRLRRRGRPGPRSRRHGVEQQLELLPERVEREHQLVDVPKARRHPGQLDERLRQAGDELVVELRRDDVRRPGPDLRRRRGRRRGVRVIELHREQQRPDAHLRRLDHHDRAERRYVEQRHEPRVRELDGDAGGRYVVAVGAQRAEDARSATPTTSRPSRGWHALTLEYNLPINAGTCDFTSPTVSRTIVARSNGNGTVGQIRQGTGYYVYAYATDPGAISSGIGSVTADVSSFDSGVTAASLSSGSWTVGGQSYNYRSSVLTADTPLLMGGVYPYSLTVTDGVGNTGSSTGNTATIERYSDVILASSGLLGYWQLGDTSSSYGTDLFTDSTGTTLTSHTGEVGASWSAISGNSTSAIITSGDRLRRSGTGSAAYYVSAVPASSSYTVEADLYVASLLSNDAAGITGRTSTSSETYYLARYNTASTRWELWKLVNGSSTMLSSSSQSLSAGSTYRMKLYMSGSSIRLYVDGAQRISVSDSSISSTGRGGLRFGTASSSQSDNTGLQLDNWVLNSSPPAAADSKGSNNGTYYNAVALGTAGAIAGSLDGAATFDGVDGYAQIARQVSDNFTIEFWFKSTQGLNTNSQWWGNAGLVDAELDGSYADFGVSLRSDGKIVAGVGPSDTSIVSSSGGFNNGAWHHVVFRRTKSSGALSLYVDGSSQGSATGSTVSLNDPSYFRFGSIQTGTYFLDGSIDEVAIYNSVMSTSTIADHYESGNGS